MARPKSTYPTEFELEILKVLWAESPLGARDVQAVLAKSRKDFARTTIVTMLNIMVDKKYLKRKRVGNRDWFSPVVTREAVKGKVLGDVVKRVFEGSASDVVHKLMDVQDIKSDELKELRKLINQKLKKK